MSIPTDHTQASTICICNFDDCTPYQKVKQHTLKESNIDYLSIVRKSINAMGNMEPEGGMQLYSKLTKTQ